MTLPPAVELYRRGIRLPQRCGCGLRLTSDGCAAEAAFAAGSQAFAALGLTAQQGVRSAVHHAG